MTQIATLSTSTNALPESWVEKMFHKMLLEYGKKFTDQWGGVDTDELIAHWARELGGYTGPEIKRGLAALDTRDWAPTLPEFKKMCRPPPNDLTAYHEAISGLEARGKGEMGMWSHPAVYWAASLLKSELMGQTYAQVKDRWAQALKGQMERTEWAEIPPARIALPAPDTSPAAKELATKMVRELGATGVIKTGKDGINHLRWAQRIMDRLARKDKELSMIQIQFAKLALGITDDAPAA